MVEYIKAFQPTKIAIEAFEGWKATDKLRGYNEGKYRDERDERFQLAIRLASELKLDTLYSINATSYDDVLVKLIPYILKSYFGISILKCRSLQCILPGMV